MKHKKAAFESINNYMIAFVGFILVTIMVLMIISTMKQTSLVCANDVANKTSTYYNGKCYTCAYNDTFATYFNTSDERCYNTSAANIQGTSAVGEYGGSAYNATKNLGDAAFLPPQFASLIVIVIIIVGILGMLTLIGYAAYKRMKD